MPEAGTCSLLSVTGTCRKERPPRESETEFGIQKVRDKFQDSPCGIWIACGLQNHVRNQQVLDFTR